MNKERFEAPEIEVIVFDESDAVLAKSNEGEIELPRIRM